MRGGTHEDVVEVDTGFEEGLNEGRIRGRAEETLLRLLDLAEDLLAFWVRTTGERGGRRGGKDRTEEANATVPRGHLLLELAGGGVDGRLFELDFESLEPTFGGDSDVGSEVVLYTTLVSYVALEEP